MMLTRHWGIPDNPPAIPDCFVVLSYALRDRKRPTRPTRAEIELAFEWWKRYPDAKIILSTGDNQGLGVTNSRVMFEYAVSLGVSRKNLIEEDRSCNTWENLQYSKAIIEKEKIKQPTLVTLDLYTRRAVAIARKQGWQNLYWLSVYSKGEAAWGYKCLQTYSRLTIFCYEMSAMFFSRLAGWV